MTEGLAASALACRVGIGLLFLSAAVPKILASQDFANAVHNYRLLPEGLEQPVARALPFAELVLGAALVVGAATRVVGLVVAAMLFVFVFAVALNLARGRHIDCGCYSMTSPRTIGWPLVVEDAFFAALAAFAALYATPSLSIGIASGNGPAALDHRDAIAVVIGAVALVEAKLLLMEVVRIRHAKARLPELSR
jgi:uncharacterized membrane protein YphA (DoxX/SURF4 family)